MRRSAFSGRGGGGGGGSHGSPRGGGRFDDQRGGSSSRSGPIASSSSRPAGAGPPAAVVPTPPSQHGSSAPPTPQTSSSAAPSRIATTTTTPPPLVVKSAASPAAAAPPVAISVATTAITTLHANANLLAVATKDEVAAAGSLLCKQVEMWLMDILALAAATPGGNVKAKMDVIEQHLFDAYNQLHTLLYVSLPAAGSVVGSCLNVEGVLYRFMQLCSCPLAAAAAAASSSSSLRSEVAARHTTAIGALVNDITNVRCYDVSSQAVATAITVSAGPAAVVAAEDEDEGRVAVVSASTHTLTPAEIAVSASGKLFVNQELTTKVTHAVLKSAPPTIPGTHLHLNRALAPTTHLSGGAPTTHLSGGAPTTHLSGGAVVVGAKKGTKKSTLHDVTIPTLGSWRKVSRNAAVANSTTASDVDPVFTRAAAAAEERVYRLESSSSDDQGGSAPPSPSSSPVELFTSLAEGSKSSRILLDKYVTNGLFMDTKQEMEFNATPTSAGSSSSPTSSSISVCKASRVLEESQSVSSVSACRDTDQITRMTRSTLYSLPLSSSSSSSEKRVARVRFLNSLLFSRRAEIIGEKRGRVEDVQYSVLEPRCLLPTKTALEEFFGAEEEESKKGNSTKKELPRMCLLERIAMTHDVVE